MEYGGGFTYPIKKGCESMNNADKIRSMTDDELNDLFHEIYDAGVDDASSYEWGQRTNSFEWTMEWLQKPAEQKVIIKL